MLLINALLTKETCSYHHMDMTLMCLTPRILGSQASGSAWQDVAAI